MWTRDDNNIQRFWRGEVKTGTEGLVECAGKLGIHLVSSYEGGYEENKIHSEKYIWIHWMDCVNF